MSTGQIFDIRRFCLHDGPGIRTTVFLAGCPLDCCWCHNPEGRDTEGPAVRQVTVEAVIDEVLKDEPFYDQSEGGVTFSGGEPLAQPVFLVDLLRKSKLQSLHTTIDTCGYAPWEVVAPLVDLVDLFLFDIKLVDPDAHLRHTGVSNEVILSNLARLSRLNKTIWLRIPLIPGITDTAVNLEEVAAFIKPLESIRRICILPYNRLGEDKIARTHLPRQSLNLESQTPDELERTASWFRSLGYDVSIGG